jgi:drug/metabolite transporter (DMT)-like permease
MLSAYHSRSETTKAHIQMHISILLWGATAVLGRGITLGEGMLVWYRMIITSCSLFIFIRLTQKTLRVPRTTLLKLAGIGVLLMIHWLFFYGAVKYSNVSITLSLFSSTTLFTALIEPVITEKKFNRAELLFSLMAMAGVCIIFYTDTNQYGIGIFLALMAAFVGAFFNILNRNVVKTVSSEVVSFYEILCGLIALTLFLPLYLHVFKVQKLWPTNTDWLLLAILAIMCTHVTLVLSLNALRHLSAFTLNLAINLEPVYGIALAFAIFGENKQMGRGFFAGTVLILASVALHGYMAARASKKEFDAP